MQKFTTLFIALGMAAAFSSCSRSNYAFNTNAPAYLGSEKTKAQMPVAEAEPIATEAVAPTVSALRRMPTYAAKATASHVAKPRAVAPAAIAEVPVTDAITNTVAKTSYTHAERKVIRHQVKKIIASHNSTTAEGKSQLVAVLLCFFLGGLGIHDFYMGRIGKGILQIFLSLILVGIILVIIDFIRLLTGSLKPKDGDWAKKL
jgi:TM2 domain-containing membrane protein YozV